jgi:hypothetical protein
MEGILSWKEGKGNGSMMDATRKMNRKRKTC